MAIVISDLHGNKLKCETFLKYKPEEEHIIIGDFLDSYHASDEDIIDTMKLAIEAGATLCIGNHELNYIQPQHSYFRCSGYRNNPIFGHYLNQNKHKFNAVLMRDGFFISHGGLSKKHGKNFESMEHAVESINTEFDKYIKSPIVPESLPWLFDIGGIRGGRQDISGIFWLTFNYGKYYNKFDQVCGHTCGKEVRINHNYKKNNYDSMHVCVDTPLYHCFNTKTREVEDFVLDEYKNEEQMRKMIERMF